MSSPDQALGHDRIALVVDLEASAVHEPGPGSSTIQRLGSTSKRPGWMRFTTSTPTRWFRQCSMKVRLNPESHHNLAKRLERSPARSAQ